MGRSHWRSFYRSLRRKIQRLFLPVCPKRPRRLSINVYICPNHSSHTQALPQVMQPKPHRFLPTWMLWQPKLAWSFISISTHILSSSCRVCNVFSCLGPKQKSRLFLLTKALKKKLRKQHTGTPVMSWQPPRSSTMLLPLALPTPSRLCMVPGIRLGLFAPPSTPFLVEPLTTPTTWQKQITRTTLSSEIPVCMASCYPQIRSCRVAWRLLLGWSTCWKMRSDMYMERQKNEDHR